MLPASLTHYDPDRDRNLATAMRLDAVQERDGNPFSSAPQRAIDHGAAWRHHLRTRRCALDGTAPLRGVYPGRDTPHSNRATVNARFCFVFVDPTFPGLPARSCTLFISPLLQQLILHLAGGGGGGYRATMRQIRRRNASPSSYWNNWGNMPVENLSLPFSSHPRIRCITDTLNHSPREHRTLPEWAGQIGMSERSLARLFIKETGMTFSHWRQHLQLIIAIRELASGTRVQRVAEDLGYDSPSAFITIFKKALGKNRPGSISPTVGRRRGFPAAKPGRRRAKKPLYQLVPQREGDLVIGKSVAATVMQRA